jgi:hypothetical protein
MASWRVRPAGFSSRGSIAEERVGKTCIHVMMKTTRITFRIRFMVCFPGRGLKRF